MPEFIYPNELPGETGAAYWARVRAMGLPYKWETDKATPPGPIEVTYEWWTRDDVGFGWKADSEQEARARFYPGSAQRTLHRRTRWTSVGDWEDVTL